MHVDVINIVLRVL